METNIIRKIIIKYGLIISSIIILWGLVNFLIDNHTVIDFTLIIINLVLYFMILPLAGIIFGQLAARKANDGIISFGTCLKVGIGIGLIYALLTTFYTFLLANFLDPDYYYVLNENIYDFSSEFPGFIEQYPSKLSFIEQEIEKASKSYPISIGIVIFISFIYSSLVGLFVKKSD